MSKNIGTDEELELVISSMIDFANTEGVGIILAEPLSSARLLNPPRTLQDISCAQWGPSLEDFSFCLSIPNLVQSEQYT